MEDLDTRNMYIAKRYFKHSRHFRDENYVMVQMGYDVYWTRDRKHNNTMSLYPHRETRNLK